MNWLDKTISWLSPTAGFKRARARHAADMVRGYEGASRGRRMANWKAGSTDANTEAASAGNRLRDRSRDLVRNNPWAARAVQVIASNTVGTGILPQAKNKRLQALWEMWGDTLACDADGRHNFYGIQALVMRSVVESGECLVRRRGRRIEDGLPLPFQLQVLEPDYLDIHKDGPIPGGYMIQGIEFNQVGKRIAYWIYTDHPGNRTGLALASRSTRVPAEDVIHVYRVDRPGQVRGVPWGAPAIVRLRDLADYEDAQLLRQKLAACFTAFVYDNDIGAGDNNMPLAESLEPGAIEILPSGKEITFANPPAAEGYGEYTANVLRAVAMAYGVTYEALTGNLSNVNFSSGRMGWIEFHRNIECWIWQMLVPQLCGGVWSWFTQAASMMQYDTAEATWTPPRREMIDPSKELKAMNTAIRSGLTSLSESIRRLGDDPEQVLTELAADLRMLDKLGLVLDSDPRRDKGRDSAQSENQEREEE
jgi:lambda family phage portal protein